MGEDYLFVLDYVLSCQKIIFRNTYAYCYNAKKSAGLTANYFPDFWEQVLKKEEAEISICKKHGFEMATDPSGYMWFRRCRKEIFNEYKKGRERSFGQQYRIIKKILSRPEAKDYKGPLHLKENTLFFNVMELFMKCRSPLLLTLMYLLYAYRTRSTRP